jgi:Ca2+-binding RTX toxin-like protein
MPRQFLIKPKKGANGDGFDKLEQKIEGNNMNMVSIAFPIEVNASAKQNQLVKKFTSVWEKKNSKAAHAGGISLMALSLAACGAEDDTPFAQADIDAATAAAQIQAATALLAKQIAEAATAAAQIQAAAAKISAETALAALVAQTNAVILATTATTTAQTAQATAEASLAAKTTEYDALITSNAALVASNAVLQASYDALVAPATANTFSTLTTDALVGRAGNDSFTAASGTVQAYESVIDNSSTDADTLTVVSALAIPATFTITNIETVNITQNNLGAIAVNTDLFSGVSTLTVTRGDVVVGGVTLTGDKTVNVQNVNGINVGIVIAGAGTTALTVVQATGAGINVDGNTVTGAVAMTGAGRLDVGSATTTVALAAMGNAVQDAKALTINADSAVTSVTTAAGFTGPITINAASARTVDVDNATGGLTLNATVGAETAVSGVGIVVGNVDASGATIITGSYASTAAGLIQIEGTVATTDVATISAAGNVNLTTNADGAGTHQVETVNLSGNGTAVTYAITGVTTVLAGSGSQTVNVSGNEASFSGTTVSGMGTIYLTAGAAGAVDASLWTSNKIDLSFDNNKAANAANNITVADGAIIEVTLDQTSMDIDYVTGATGNLTIVAGDDNGTSADIGTITFGALLDAASANATDTGTVTIEANIANVTATATTLNAGQALVVTGDENVNLGIVTAASLTANASSGIITATSTTSATTMITGSGADQLTTNSGVTVHNMTSGSGNDTFTITATAATSSFDGGAGLDTFTITSNAALVAVGGDGADSFDTGSVIDAVIVGGAGLDDFTIDATRDLSLQANFNISDVETFDISAGNLTMSAAQFANNNTVALISTNDTFTVNAVATTGSTIDASNLTFGSGAAGSTVILNGNIGSDTITGGVAAEKFTQTAGADTISGGSTGVDQITLIAAAVDVDGSASGQATSGAIINMGTTAISAATVTGDTGLFISKNLTEIAAGKASYLFAADATTNISDVDSIDGIENIIGTAAIDFIVGSSGANVINTGGGGDTVIAGDGGDTINVGNAATVVAATRIDGGPGTDNVNVTADNVGVGAVFNNLTGVETITVVPNATASNNITIALTHTAANTEAMTIIAAALIDTSAQLTIDASADAEVDGVLTIIGGAGNDTITAGDGGGSITGGGGADAITGHTGADVINLAFGAAATSVDTINTFSVAADTITFTGTSDVNDAIGSDLDVDGFILDATSGTENLVEGFTVFSGAVMTAVDAGATLTAAEIAIFLSDTNGGGGGTNKVSVATSTDVAYVLVEGQGGASTLARVTGGADTTIDTADVTLVAHFIALESEDFLVDCVTNFIA